MGGKLPADFEKYPYSKSGTARPDFHSCGSSTRRAKQEHSRFCFVRTLQAVTPLPEHRAGFKASDLPQLSAFRDWAWTGVQLAALAMVKRLGAPTLRRM